MKTKFRIGRFRKILAFIKANPKHWDQTTWHCGTTHCVAGFAECALLGLSFKAKESTVHRAKRNALFDDAVPFFSTPENAQEYLGLTETQAFVLFRARRTLDDLKLVGRLGVAGIEELRRRARAREAALPVADFAVA